MTKSEAKSKVCQTCRDEHEVWCLGGMAGEIIMPCPTCRPKEFEAEKARREALDVGAGQAAMSSSGIGEG